MKKLILSVLLVAAAAFTANAQRMSKNALGLRFGGDSENSGFEISYQHKLAKSNRLELDLGWRNDNHDNYSTWKFTGLYQWAWKIDGGLNWYAGVGAGLGSYKFNGYYDHHGHYYYDGDSDFFAALDGDIGIEYNFDIPLQIALDLRPELYFGGDYYHNDNFYGNLGLALRYRF